MQFHFEHQVPGLRDAVFGFHENPANITVLHGGWSQVRVLQAEPEIRVGAETWVEFTLAGFLPVVLGFRHHLFEPPSRFGEELIHGPFSQFSHVHEFEAQNGQTVVRDLLQVQLAWQYGGEWATKRVLAPMISQAFNRRGEAMRSLAQDGTIERFARHRTGNQS